MSGARQHCKRPPVAPPGISLAFLALAVQALLPFLIAFDITLASRSAPLAPVTVICSAARLFAPAAPDGASHHSLDGGCPICTALAANQSMTASSPVVLPLPQSVSLLARDRIAVSGAPVTAIASYDSRAPPSTL